MGDRCPPALLPVALAAVALAAPLPAPGAFPVRGAASPLAAQELRGWLVAEGESGYLSNAYLDPVFPSWDPAAEGGFFTAGATGRLDLLGDATRVWLSGGASRTELGNGPAWHGWLGRVGAQRRLAPDFSGALEVALADLRRDGSRRTLWTRAEARWNASPSVRLRAGPGLALRSLPVRAVQDPVDPPLFPPFPPPGGEEERARAIGYLLLAGMEARTGTRWRWDLEAFAARTEAEDLGVDYLGGGARARVSRSFPGGARAELGGGLEGFGYRAVVEGSGVAEGNIPANDLSWRTEAALALPTGRRTETTLRLSGLGIREPDGGRGFEWRAAAGVRIALGGRVAGPRPPILWRRTEDGLRLEVPYDGRGELYLTGDFSDWADPGQPLVREEHGRHGTTLRVPPGRYQYGIRVRENGEVRWLDLPDGIPKVDDGFGGENGLLVVEAAGSRPGSDEENGR